MPFPAPISVHPRSAAAPSAAGPPAPSQALTLRAFVLGMVLVAVLCGATPYVDLYLQGSELVGNHLPLGAFCLLLLLVALTGLTARIAPRAARFSRGELLLVFVMLLVAAGIPTWGLAGYLFPAISAAQYYNKKVLLPLIPPWMIPDDATAIQYFYSGLPAGAAIPWQPWVRPLLAWSVLVAALYLLMVSLSVLIAAQWIHRERLAFPLMHIPLEVTRRGSSWNWREPRLWAGIGLPLALHSLNGMHAIYPAIPNVELRAIPVFTFSDDPPLSLLRADAYLYFSVIGIAYFLPSEISFSVWFFYLAGKLQSVIAYLRGADVLFQEVVESQYIGAFVAFVAGGLWLAAPHFRLVLRAMLRPRAPGGEDGYAYRGALLGMVISAILFTGWFRAAGVAPMVPLLALLIFAVTCLGLGRFVAQSGVLSAKATQMMPLVVFSSLAGTRWLAPGEIATLGLVQYVFMFDLKAFLMPALAHSHKLAHEAGIRRRQLLIAIAAALVVGVVVSYASLIIVGYRQGAAQLSPWFFVRGPQAHLSRFEKWIEAPTLFSAPRLITAGLGAAFTFFLSAMHQRFLWWPFHPAGYVLAYSSETTRVWLAFLLGWLCKGAVLRAGGFRVYRLALPFFQGLIIGEFVAAGIWTLITAAGGVAGFRIFP